MDCNFPIELLKPEYSAICFFSAAFGGENDVKYLHEAGMKDVFLIDNDLEKLKAVAEKFGYEFGHMNAFDLIEFDATPDTDIIICDQWTNHDDLINRVYFDNLLAAAQRYLIIGISRPYLDTLPEKPHGEYLKRSDHMGGVYWRIIKV